VECAAKRVPEVLRAAKTDGIDLVVVDRRPGVEADMVEIARLLHAYRLPSGYRVRSARQGRRRTPQTVQPDGEGSMARPRAALTLDDLAATRRQPPRRPRERKVPPPRANDPVGEDDRTRRGQTLRLEPEAWRQLKMLVIEQGTTSHDLLQAVNLLFDHYNRPTIPG
jgi:hypothetical protein